MVNIFNYTDYRKYLQDYYDDRRKEDNSFSLRKLASLSGINAGNLTKILKGERNLTLSAASRICRTIQLNKKERDYFNTMVLFCQAKTLEEKKHYFEELSSFKESSVRILDATYYTFYDKWYYTAVREALAFFPLTDNNMEELGKCIIPKISKKQVKEAISLLLKLGLIKKDPDGNYSRTDALISTGNNIRSLTLNNFVINTMKLAAEAINKGLKETNLSSVTFSIAEKEFNLIQEEIRRCRRNIMEIAKNCSDPDRVYQLNIQLFPLTNRYKGRSK
ncbi:MAG: TIGR02147 family protein [Chitinispirillaceae bacterium]|nr:TIGR02147 family protein [Chitinispirillaceae bacterium]